ncbi:LysR family transcriptional regulator [Spirillospora sp. CA-294931]|uniref:LysR family transcriptional regulator n=1 Tax=Spirillospora sp. CA-294931 TaxID=3240042 RepID=UPI003D8B5B56
MDAVRLELRHLRVLKAVADAGSVTRAAAALGVSQPALTAQLHRIEALVGGEVFSRGRHGAVPTPFGEFVLSRARAALDNVDAILDARPGEDELSSVRLGGIEASVVIDLSDRLDELFPGLEITVTTEYSDRLLLDMVTTGRLDCVLVADYPGHELVPGPSLTYRVVAVEPVFVMLPRTHPAAAGDEVELTDLAKEAWVVSPPDGTGWPEHFFETCERLGFRPKTRYQITQRNLRFELISSGRAVVTCEPRLAERGDAVVRPLAGSPLWMRHVVAWNPAGPMARHADDLVTLTRECHARATERAPVLQDWLRRHGPPEHP